MDGCKKMDLETSTLSAADADDYGDSYYSEAPPVAPASSSTSATESEFHFK